MKLNVYFRGMVFLVMMALSGAPLLKSQETIVAIRHGEKPRAGLGQLDCKGLNRALALPKVLIGQFGRPDAIYAPDPADVDVGPGGRFYSYVRPLMTIEPTAIVLGMPVNAQIGFRDIGELRVALTAPQYGHALIFVAWEHKMLNEFARQILRSYGENPDAVPEWPKGDYDRIYVFQIRKVDGKAKLSFRVTEEGLNGKLSATCPGY
jgi:hypothetical protein